MRKTKMGVSEANGHRFGLKPPPKGSAGPQFKKNDYIFAGTVVA
jgi:hypothetical protein